MFVVINVVVKYQNSKGIHAKSAHAGSGQLTAAEFSDRRGAGAGWPDQRGGGPAFALTGSCDRFDDSISALRGVRERIG